MHLIQENGSALEQRQTHNGETAWRLGTFESGGILSKKRHKRTQDRERRTAVAFDVW
jgi:hypothetical protein